VAPEVTGAVKVTPALLAAMRVAEPCAGAGGMEGKTDGDFDDFERALHQLEVDFPGAMVLGTDWTISWPSYRVHESRPSLRDSAPDRIPNRRDP
jgi:hypothetical protein